MFSPPRRGNQSHSPEDGGGGGRSDPRGIGGSADGREKSVGFIQKQMIESWSIARKEESELRRRTKNPTFFRNSRGSWRGVEWDSSSSWKKEKEMKSPLLNEYSGRRADEEALDREALLARIRELEDQLQFEEDFKQELENFEGENDEFILKRNELDDEIDDYWKSSDINVEAIKLFKECSRSYANLRTQFFAFVVKLNECVNCGAPTTKLTNVIAEVQSGNWELKDGPLFEAEIALEKEFVGLRLEEERLEEERCKSIPQSGSQRAKENASSRRNTSTCIIS